MHPPGVHTFYSGSDGVARTPEAMALIARSGPIDRGLAVSLQTSLFGSTKLGCNRIRSRFEALDSASSVLFEPGWVQGSDRVFDRLRRELPWKSMERPMYDRVVAVPRLICTVRPGDLMADHPLARITRELETALQQRYLSIGVNFYRTGNDSVAWHSDSIGRSGIPATVALVSLGSPRTLAMRPVEPNRSKTAETTRSTAATRRRWTLGHGDLLVMAGGCQHRWEHCVPKERGVGPRISLAFRSTEAVGGPHISTAGVPPLRASCPLR